LRDAREAAGRGGAKLVFQVPPGKARLRNGEFPRRRAATAALPSRHKRSFLGKAQGVTAGAHAVVTLLENLARPTCLGIPI